MKTPLLQDVFKGKPPREAPPPSRWGQSRNGRNFVLRKAGFRNRQGQKLYRLGFYETDDGKPLFSSAYWTLAALQKEGVIWLDKCPVAQEVEVQVQDDPPPEGCEVDSDPEPWSSPLAEPLQDIKKAVAKIEATATSVPRVTATVPGTGERVTLKPSSGLGPGNHPKPKLPEDAESRFGMSVGETVLHDKSRNLYRIIGVVDRDTFRVQQVLESGAKTPARNMKGIVLSRIGKVKK